MQPAALTPARLALLLAFLVGTTSQIHAEEPNSLSPAENNAGWRLLFDGKTTQGWHSPNKNSFPDRGWVIEDGWLKKVARVRGGDIVSQDEFDDFELQWDWIITPKGNNGLKYFITSQRGGVGHEYQMLDDLNGPLNKHSTASFYDVLPPTVTPPLKPAGQINHSRLLVQGNHVEHWLNGTKVLEYTLGSPDLLAAVAHSKFKPVAGFGTKVKGHILLTDHGDGASFRSIKIRPIPPAHP